MDSWVSGTQLYRNVISKLYFPSLFQHSSYSWVSREGLQKMLGLPRPIHHGQVSPRLRKAPAICQGPARSEPGAGNRGFAEDRSAQERV